MKPVKSSRAKRRREIAKLTDPNAGKRFERDSENALIDLEERIEERYAYAQSILKIQSDETKRVVVRLVEQMKRMAGEPVFKFEGQTVGIDPDRASMLQERNFTWIAVRLLAACAVWDIQIGEFKLPTNQCAKCGVERS